MARDLLFIDSTMLSEPTILVPIDFSTHSRAAVERAASIALASNARIHLLHALDFPPFALNFSFSDSAWIGFRRAAQVELLAWQEDLVKRGLMVTACVQEGDAADTIRSAAWAPDVVMVVMGSHGRRGRDRFLLGSVAERMLHGTPVPVMVVRESVDYAAEPIQTILFATDFSNGSEQAERAVILLAKALGCRVEVFHAIQETAVLFAPYAVGALHEAEIELQESAQLRMEGCLKRFQDAGLLVRSKIVRGYASEEILKRAEFAEVELIAMGTRGYSGLKRFRLGSVSQRVSRDAPCSVLVAGARPTQPTV